MLEKSHDIAVVNSLIETTLDSIDGYRRAAEEATNGRFSSEFVARAEERRRVVDELQQEVRRLGGTPEDDGSVLAAAHRAFLTIRDRVTGSDDKSVLAEVDRGESYLDEKWQAALRDDQLSPEVRSVITRNYDSVRSGRERGEAVHRSLEAAG
ncbi:MAG: hypothetical protein JWN69_1273 [Alphaproteobacteria bacterium]|nr:hypothetical protein [Alphaproteobacteria bacterium]